MKKLKHLKNLKKLNEIKKVLPNDFIPIIINLQNIELKIHLILNEKIASEVMAFELWNDIDSLISNYLELISKFKPEKFKDIENSIKTIKLYVHKKYIDEWKVVIVNKKFGSLLWVLNFIYTTIVIPIMNTLFNLEREIYNYSINKFIDNSLPRFKTLEKYTEEIKQVVK